ncbi:hypothetical protein HY620_03130 [Candidatus Uhrbacteria bacterium]|nr:hypothetical protein [Candidatus Uhrbacteria bacterium]
MWDWPEVRPALLDQRNGLWVPRVDTTETDTEVKITLNLPGATHLFEEAGALYRVACLADALAIPLNTVKTNLRRAKQALGDILQNTYA